MGSPRKNDFIGRHGMAFRCRSDAVDTFDYFIDSGHELLELTALAAPPRRSTPPRESRSRKHSQPPARTSRRNEDSPSMRVGHPLAHTLRKYPAGPAVPLA